MKDQPTFTSRSHVAHFPSHSKSFTFPILLLLLLPHHLQSSQILPSSGFILRHPRQQGRTQAEGKGGPGPPWVQKFFFLVYKIFIKKAWAPWFLAWAPLTSPIPIPASQPRSFQEPMKTLKNIYMCKKEKRKKKKRRKPSSQ